MDTAGRRERTPLEDELFSTPRRFDFFQAVRLLETWAAARAGGSPDVYPVLVGVNGPADRELVEFVATRSLAFPASEISSIEPLVSDARTSDFSRVRMAVNFMGLTGPSGTLPRHYSSLVIERSQPAHKNLALYEFFDLFNHRAVSLFYRSWQKYRLAVLYERFRNGALFGETADEDGITGALYALIGLGTSGVRQRLQIDDQALLYYAGLFAPRVRCCVNLRQLVADMFRIVVDVCQFQGQWLYLEQADQSSLPAPDVRDGDNTQLGVTAIAGSKVWSVQSKFRVRLGPLAWQDFVRFLPNGSDFVPLCQLVRLYVGAEFDFDVQVILKRVDVPECQLNADAARGGRLGWNTWVRTGDLKNDAEDAVFAPAGC